uniref:Uncharacterized protein n=1 Tax=Takifugu rubripes TaxID=31033 RepID=A0A3B5K8T6_TAKRU
QALDFGYSVDFCEPKTNWKFEPRELEKRNKHGVSQQKIAQMMERFTFPISIDISALPLMQGCPNPVIKGCKHSVISVLPARKIRKIISQGKAQSSC